MKTGECADICTDNMTELKSLILRTDIIGVDIDGTLSDTINAALAEVRRKYGNIMDFSQWKSWNPHQIHELQSQGIITIEDTIKLFSSILQDGGSQSIYPIDGSVRGIQLLQSLQKELIALSGRMETTRSYTTGWLNEFYPGVFQKTLLTDHDTPKQVSKHVLAKEYGIGLMIEDNAHYAIDLATHGIPTILLEAPWNVEIDVSIYTDIYRVRDWHQILGLIQ